MTAAPITPAALGLTSGLPATARRPAPSDIGNPGGNAGGSGAESGVEPVGSEGLFAAGAGAPLSASACPACIAAPSAEDLAQAGMLKGARIMLSLPSAHCATCISDVERELMRQPGVRSARVNLTLKRVSVDAAAGVEPAGLVSALEAIGYEAHELDADLLSATETDKRGRDLLMRIGVAGFAMMNIMLLSVAVWSGAGAATRDLFHWISAAIALPTVIFAGRPFFVSALAGVRRGRLNMDFPISLAIVLASSISLFETINHGRHAYFDAAVMLTFFLLLGRYLDYRTRAIARSAAEELAALEVPRAHLLRDGAEQLVAVSDLRPGDLVRVRPGNRVPADGEVVEGMSEIDRSLLTGETLPVQAAPGTALSTGEVNLTGPLTLRVTAAGRDSSLHRMADLVAAAESAKTKYTSLAERAARGYSPVVHTLAFSSFVVWMWLSGGDVRLAINIAAAVLIITCPCALGLAVPAVVTAASGKLFRKGLLIKDGTALERLAEVDTVVFDKTGTLTLGTPEPQNLDVLTAQDFAVVAALAAGSAHPLARALHEAGIARAVSPAPVSDLREVPGHGIEARGPSGEVLRLGRADWTGASEGALTATHLRIGSAPPVSLTFADRLRPGAEEAVSALAAQGMRVMLLSGDTEAPVAALAARLGIAQWQSGARPEDKAARIAEMTDAGHRVLMVGDGLNDTAALASAHVSISPASALDAARTASDIVLLGRDLAPVADAARIARQTRARIKENFAISFLYNVVAVPLALVGMATPLAAALAMSVSSITVSLNALRLK